VINVALRDLGFRALPGLDPDEMDRNLAAGATLPSVFYTDPSIAALEDELIFRPSWQIVGIEPELRNVGDYFTTDISGYGFAVPIVVLRDEEMALRAFVNVCRHRAHAVAVGCGNRKALQCTYHGWVYGLNGCLRAVPRSGEGGLPPFEQLGLLPLPVDSWKGYILVSLKGEESLADALGELPAVLEAEGFDFPFAQENVEADFAYTRLVIRYGGPSNWKAMNENNIECYHCPTTHTHSFSEMFKVDPAHYLHREFDRGVYHTSYFQDSVADSLGLTDRSERPHYQFYYLWPNMYMEGGLSQAGNGSSFLRLWPDGVHAWAGETVRYPVPGDEGVEPKVAAQIAEWNRMTGEEDREAAARVQAGHKSGMYTWGYTLRESERNMRHFYALVWRALEPAFRA
jgi:phenylpropionate dioxygenase-like ring-hydroxylating dioxygenase large terminal subunit